MVTETKGEEAPSSQKFGVDHIVLSCWELQSLELCAPADVVGSFSVTRAWFGDPVNASRRVDVTQKVRSAVQASGTFTVLAHTREFGNPAPDCFKRLQVECQFEWLTERETSAWKDLVAKTSLDSERCASILARLQGLWERALEHEGAKARHGEEEAAAPVRSSALGHQLRLLELRKDVVGLAVDGLTYVAECRERDSVMLQLSCETLGFPLAMAATEVAQILARYFWLSSGGQGRESSLSYDAAPRCVVQGFARRLSMSSGQSAFGVLFADLMKEACEKWKSDRVAAAAAAGDESDDIHKVLQWIASEAVAKAVRARWGSSSNLPRWLGTNALCLAHPQAVYSEVPVFAEHLAFCPLCLRPLQQFPDDVGALTDAQGNRVEGALYHRRCLGAGPPLLRSSFGPPPASGCRAAPRLLHGSAGHAARGFRRLPPLWKPAAWAKFVAAEFPGSSRLPCHAVARALAAALPFHAWHLELMIKQRFGASFPVSALERVAAWACEQQSQLAEGGRCLPAFWLLAAQDDPSSWSAWFRSFDVEGEGRLPRGLLGLALASGARAAADHRATAAAFTALPRAVARLVSHAWFSSAGESTAQRTVGLGVFLREIAPLAASLLQSLLASPEDHLPPVVVTAGGSAPDHGMEKTMGSPAKRSSSQQAASDGSKGPASASTPGMCCVTLCCLSGHRRILRLPTEFYLRELEQVVQLLVEDSLSFAPAQQARKCWFYFAGRQLGQSLMEAQLQDIGIKNEGTILVLVDPAKDKPGVAEPEHALVKVTGKVRDRMLAPLWVVALLLLALRHLLF